MSMYIYIYIYTHVCIIKDVCMYIYIYIASACTFNFALQVTPSSTTACRQLDLPVTGDGQSLSDLTAGSSRPLLVLKAPLSVWIKIHTPVHGIRKYV